MSEKAISSKPRLKQIRYDLRKKITTIMVGTIVVTSATLLVFSMLWGQHLERQFIRKNVTRSLERVSEHIKAQGNWQSEGNITELRSYVLRSVVGANPYISQVTAYNEEGAMICFMTEALVGQRGSRRSGQPSVAKPPSSTRDKLQHLVVAEQDTCIVVRVIKDNEVTAFLRADIFHPAFDVNEDLAPNLIVIGVMTLLTLLLSLTWARRMARPLREVIQVADEVAHGQAFREVKVGSSDEAGVIAGLFNDINKRLQDRINDMAMLQLWSMDIGAELDREELNNIIVTTFANATGARRVALLLRDRNAGSLTVAAGIHVTNPRLSYPDNTGLAGEVLAADSHVVTNDLGSYADATLFHNDPATAKAGIWYLGLPVIAQGKAIGVLVLGDRAVDGDKEFDPEAIILFQTLATSAGGALDNARLYDLAITDELTRVYIRRFYNQRLDEEIEIAVNAQAPLSLIMLDIDHFKRFNDTYGHQTGDRVLIALANLLRETVRGIDVQEAERRRDIVARYGGEEFSVILPNTPLAGALLVAERLRYNIENFSEMFSDAGKQLSITISLGVAEWQPGQQAAHLIHCADEALYEAKHRGRNRVVAWPFAGAESAPPA